MKPALILGSLGAALLLSKKQNRDPADDVEVTDLDVYAELHTPMPGTFYLPPVSGAVCDGGPYSISAFAVSSLSDSMRESGMVDARQHSSMRRNPVFHEQMAQLIHCSPFNDGLYGQSNRNVSPRESRGRHGRSIVIEPKFCNVLEMIKSGERLRRSTDESGRLLPGASMWQGDLQPSHMPLVWVPFICPYALKRGHVTTEGYEYEDGSSTINPPPEVMVLLA